MRKSAGIKLNLSKKHQEQDDDNIEPIKNVMQIGQCQRTAAKPLVDFRIAGHGGNRHKVRKLTVVDNV